MKTLSVLLVALGLTSVAFADIQDPPGNDYGPTRKLGRGYANLLYGATEIPTTIATVNTNEGNSAALSYGIVRGFWRGGARTAAGLLEILTFPSPAWRDGYHPMLPSDIP